MASGRNAASWTGACCRGIGLNSAYLALRSDPNPFYFANVALHPLLGLALAASVGPRLRRGLRALAGPEGSPRSCSVARPGLASRSWSRAPTCPYRPLLWAHIALAALGATRSSSVARRSA